MTSTDPVFVCPDAKKKWGNGCSRTLSEFITSREAFASAFLRSFAAGFSSGM